MQQIQGCVEADGPISFLMGYVRLRRGLYRAESTRNQISFGLGLTACCEGIGNRVVNLYHLFAERFNVVPIGPDLLTLR